MITIIVPIYKISEEYLRTCIESIRSQSSERWKLILVDDGSPDNCGEICEEYAKLDDKISVIHQENQGVSVARNTGINATDTQWVTFIDPDDWIEATEVESVLSSAENNDVDIIAFGYRREFVDHFKLESLQNHTGIVSGELLKSARIAPLHRFICNDKIEDYSINAIWNKAYRLDFLKSNKIEFEPAARKGQDRVFNLYAFHCTDKIYYINDYFYHYRNDNETSAVNKYNKNTVEYAEITFDLMRNWIKCEKHSDIYDKMLDCRICIRFYEYMNLYFYNKENKESRKNVNKEIKSMLTNEPYRSALKNVDFSILATTEKVFVAFLKIKFLSGCRFLINLQRYRKKKV